MADQQVINYWLEAAKVTAPFLASGIASWVAFSMANRRMQKENPMLLQRQKYEAILSAHRNAWALVAYMTETENSKSIITWVQMTDGKQFMFHPNRASEFLNDLRRIFYDEGHGVFFSRKVSDAIFNYRSIVYSILLAEKEKTEPVLIRKKEITEKLFRLADELRTEIRAAIEVKERILRLE